MHVKNFLFSSAWQLFAASCLPLLMYYFITQGNSLIAGILLFLQAILMALLIIKK
ncbi:MAG: hypothetical protein HRU28_11015 [Rhizobiales bacterium]|nr:hypothetical protein [Hyphomicrobiales bacterium]